MTIKERTMNRREPEPLRHNVAAGSCALDTEAPPNRPWLALAEGCEAILQLARRTGATLLAAGLQRGASLRAGRFTSFVATSAGRVAEEERLRARINPRADSCGTAQHGRPRLL
jgi:hypothetical protein